MKAVEDRFTLVMVGAFNPAILSPQWVAKFALKREDNQELQVQMLTQVGGVPARLTFDDLSYSPFFGALTFYLDQADQVKCERSVVAAANILQELPHTPISGIGFNFAFSVSDPGEKLLSVKIAQDALTDSFPGEPDVVIHRWGTRSVGKALLSISTASFPAERRQSRLIFIIRLPVSKMRSNFCATKACSTSTTPKPRPQHLH